MSEERIVGSEPASGTLPDFFLCPNVYLLAKKKSGDPWIHARAANLFATRASAAWIKWGLSVAQTHTSDKRTMPKETFFYKNSVFDYISILKIHNLFIGTQ